MKRIVEVKSKKELSAFIDFPHDLYKNDPVYVPELFIGQRDLLTTHPFHKHSSLQCFLLYDGDKITGRIAAILNNRHNDFYAVKEGFFGFFDVINDAESAQLLISTAEKWLKEKDSSLNNLVGPVNLTTNDTAGLQIKGFEYPPLILTTYNFPYYEQLLENTGLKKQVDLISWRWDKTSYDDRSVRISDKLEERINSRGVTIRKLNMKKFKEEAEKFKQVYNSAWDKNMGFVPLTDEEFDFIAKDLKMIVDPDFLLIAEKDGKFVGLGVALPDINQIQKNIPKGRLLPTGIFKLLFGLKKIRGIRIFMLGVIEGYRHMGIEAVLYAKIIKTYREKEYDYAEAGWTLEHNHPVNNAIRAIKGDPYKTHRIYEKAI
jgi:GNAT superfamily N-acetyltransferase